MWKFSDTESRRNILSNNLIQVYAVEILAHFRISFDAQGFHFVASLCQPNGASSYLVDNIVSDKGDILLNIVE